MNFLAERKVELAAALLALTVIVGAAHFLIANNLLAMRASIETHRTLTQRVTEQQAQIALLTQSDRKLEELRTALTQYETRFAATRDFDAIYTLIVATAERHRLQLRQMQPLPEVSSPAGISELPIELNLEGGFGDLHGFLEELFAQSFVIHLRDLTIARPEEEGTAGKPAQITMRLALSQIPPASLNGETKPMRPETDALRKVASAGEGAR
jgi:Tfp pilus assembly protein PilO